MKYSKTTLMELSHKYRSILRRCAFLNAAILLSAAIALPAGATTIPWDGTSDFTINSPDDWKSYITQTVTGKLSGTGTIVSRPTTGPSVPEAERESTTLTVNSDISDFNGVFDSAILTNGSIGSIVLKNRNTDGIRLHGSGDVIFDGTENVKLLSVEPDGNTRGRVFLNENTLTTDSTNIQASLYLGGKNTNDSGRNIELNGYNLASTNLFAGGANNEVNGNVATSVKNSTFSDIVGNGGNTDVTGNINLSLDNVTAANVLGNAGNGGSLVNGDINVNVENSTISSMVFGQRFVANGTNTTGTTGTININVDNSEIGRDIRGSGMNATVDQTYANYDANYLKTNDINITVKDSTIHESILGLGSYNSAQDVTINVSGNSTITKKIVAGPAAGASARNTEINLNTNGTITVNDYVDVGAKDTSSTVIGNATLNLLGGGNIAVKGLRSQGVAGTSTLNLSDVTVAASENVLGFDTINIDENAVLNLTGTLTLAEESTLNIANLLNGTVISGGTIKTNGATLTADSFVVSNAGKYTFASSNFIDGDNAEVTTDDDFNLSDSIKAAIDNNLVYDITYSKGTFTVAERSDTDIAGDIISGGATAQEANTAAAVADADSAHPVVAAITQALQTGDVAAVTKAAKDLAPTTSQQVLGVTQSVNGLLSNLAGGRMAVLGKSGGDAFIGGGTWVQGLYNHTKQSKDARTDGFRANSRGIALGLDGKINEAVTIGIGYGYTDTDAKAGGHNVDVDGNNIFAYAQYQPDAWYVNGMLNYGFAKYTEKKAPMGVAMQAKYDVKSYAANLMTGYDFESGFTPEAGLRYLLVDQKDYNDGVQTVRSDNSEVLTGVVGVKYTANIKANDWTFKPTLRLAATYDVKSDDSKANVTVTGGGNYQITGERLHRFGTEAGVGVGATCGDWELSVDYNGSFRKDFQSHTGMLKAKYNF